MLPDNEHPLLQALEAGHGAFGCLTGFPERRLPVLHSEFNSIHRD